MDWLAEKLLQNYRARIDDESYMAEKTIELGSMNRLQAMKAIGDLDVKGRAMLCSELEINEADLTAFLRVLRAL